MTIRLPTVAFAALLLATVRAEAGSITGRFSGLVENSFLATGLTTSTNIDGQPASGIFTASDNGCVPIYGYCAGSVEIVFTVNGATLPFGGSTYGADTIRVDNTAGGQQITLQPDGPGAPTGAFLTFGGMPDAFVDGTAYGTLHPGQVDLSTVSASFTEGRSYRAGIAVTSFTIDGVPVPEPASLTLLATGLAVLIGIGTARRRRCTGFPGADFSP